MSKGDSNIRSIKVRTVLIRWGLCSVLALFSPFIIAGNIGSTPVFEETSFTLIVDKAGASEIPAAISGSNVYLSISDLFTFLRIKNSVSEGSDSISGFFLNPSDPYLVDKSKNLICYRGKYFNLTNSDLIKTKKYLFLSTQYFQEIFGLECSFSFKTLVVKLKSKNELPLFRSIRQDELRKYIKHLKGEIIADTVVKRKYPIIDFGTIDWALYSTQFMNGSKYLRGYLNFGAILAGGEAEIGLHFYSNQAFSHRDQLYRWRYVNNDHKALRQIVAGKIATPSISSIYSNVIGFQVTNAPSYYRKYFGTYSYHDITEPGWTVELYVNNTLVDYTKADASGFFRFEVPLSYGNTEIKLRYYGPWGEEKSRQKNILIPYTLLPKNEFEYTLSAGMIEDSTNQLFCRASINYGILKNLTIGAGNEYLSSNEPYKNIPFITTSFRIARNILLTGEYDYGVRAKAWVSWRMPSNIVLEATYTKYDKNQKAINNNFREERKGSISFPFRARKISGFTRVAVNQIILPGSLQITLSDFMFSVNYRNVSGNLHTYGFFNSFGNPDVYTDLSIGLRIPLGIYLTPSVRYDHIRNNFSGWKCIIEKPFFSNGFFNITYEQYANNNIRNLQVGLRYIFAFAQTSIYGNQNNNVGSLSINANGSLLIDPSRSYLKASNINKVGRGSITVLPFLDINGNGKRDKGEPKVSGLIVSVLTGGLVEQENKDTLIRIYDLEPYINTILKVNSSHLENISWQLSKSIYSTTINPNMMLLIEVPVSVVSEISGTIYKKGLDKEKRHKSVKVSIYKNDTIFVASFYSDEDGNYNYLGLKQGDYIITLDTTQLSKLHLKSVPGSKKFTVLSSRNGIVINEIDFNLENIKPESSVSLLPSADSTLNTIGGIDQTSAFPAHLASNDTNKISGQMTDGFYIIQVAALIDQSKAKYIKRKIETMFNVNADIVRINNYYHVIVKGFSTRLEATETLNKLVKNGYPGAFIKKEGK